MGLKFMKTEANKQIKHSQNDEEPQILAYFGGYVGRFLDLGANDGQTLSNSRALVLRGWEGVLVEPSPVAFGKLSSLYPSSQKLLNCAVGESSGEVEFFENPDTLVSTAIVGEMDRWGRGTFSKTKVKMVSVGELMQMCPSPFDFVSIDCEGLDVPILRGLVPFCQDTRLFCVEHNSVSERKAEILSLLPGYKVLLENAENFLLAKAT